MDDTGFRFGLSYYLEATSTFLHKIFIILVDPIPEISKIWTT
jgi:hypothetical protein